MSLKRQISISVVELALGLSASNRATPPSFWLVWMLEAYSGVLWFALMCTALSQSDVPSSGVLLCAHIETDFFWYILIFPDDMCCDCKLSSVIDILWALY